MPQGVREVWSVVDRHEAVTLQQAKHSFATTQFTAPPTDTDTLSGATFDSRLMVLLLPSVQNTGNCDQLTGPSDELKLST